MTRARRKSWKLRLMSAFTVLTVLAMASCGGDEGTREADDDGLVTVKLALFPSFTSQSLTSIAQREGLFEKHGIKIEETRVTAGPVMLSALMSGEVDFTTAPTNVLYPLIEQGLALVMSGSRPEFNIIRKPDADDWPNADSDDPLERISDLKGKTVSVVAKGGVVDLYLIRALEAAGLTPGEDVTVIATGGAPTAVPAFQNDQVDAMVTFSPTEAMLGEAGEDYVYVIDSLNGDYQPLGEMVVDIWSTTEEFLDNNEETVKNFCSALREADAILQDSTKLDTSFAAVGGALGLEPDVAKKAVSMYAQVVKPDIDADLWAAQKEFAADDVDSSMFDSYDELFFGPCATGDGL